jgi:hypothetical protein
MANNINDSFLQDLSHTGDFSSNNSGDLKLVSGRDNLRQAILHRLITVQGSIIHRPDYGVGVKLYQGMISTLEKQRELALRIRQQLELDDRIDSVDSVRFTPDEDYRQGTFIINIKITASGIGELEQEINPFDKE